LCLVAMLKGGRVVFRVPQRGCVRMGTPRGRGAGASMAGNLPIPSGPVDRAVGGLLVTLVVVAGDFAQVMMESGFS